jgi:hypothetical protein
VITEVVLGLGRHFGVRFDRPHNNSTPVSYCGQYRAASGRKLRGHRAPAIVYEFNKGQMPDLKRLLFILAVEDASGVPVAFRCADGNTSDSCTHSDTGNTLRAVAGRADFMYGADGRSCVVDTLITIDRRASGEMAPPTHRSPWCTYPSRRSSFEFTEPRSRRSLPHGSRLREPTLGYPWRHSSLGCIARDLSCGAYGHATDT